MLHAFVWPTEPGQTEQLYWKVVTNQSIVLSINLDFERAPIPLVFKGYLVLRNQITELEILYAYVYYWLLRQVVLVWLSHPKLKQTHAEHRNQNRSCCWFSYRVILHTHTHTQISPPSYWCFTNRVSHAKILSSSSVSLDCASVVLTKLVLTIAHNFWKRQQLLWDSD